MREAEVFSNLVQRTEALMSAPRSEDLFMQPWWSGGGGVGGGIMSKVQPWFLSFGSLDPGPNIHHLSSYWPENTPPISADAVDSFGLSPVSGQLFHR